MGNLIILSGDEIMEDEMISKCGKHREADKLISGFVPKELKVQVVCRILLKHIVNKRLGGSGLDVSEHNIVLFGSIKTGNFFTSFSLRALFRVINQLVTEKVNWKNEWNQRYQYSELHFHLP